MGFIKSQVNHLRPKRRRSSKAVRFLALLCPIVVIGSTYVLMPAKLKSSAINVLRTGYADCEGQCRPPGSETLPKGVVSSTSDLEFHSLWESPIEKKLDMSLLAMAVGKKQKANVDKTVRKFLNHNFTVMLFHYDGNVDDWGDLEWSPHAVHISAVNQTKWWFAKRFLHPDIVAKYLYIFIWDEDLGVENFNVQSYLSVVKNEGLEISQPAIDLSNSTRFHHNLTVRQTGKLVHRRYCGILEKIKCDESSTEPPCTGFVEMMAPVFSRAAWRCTWYMIQNDLVHAWGVDYHYGYCAQGDRTQNVGVVDSDYIFHYGGKALSSEAEAEKTWKKYWEDMAIFMDRWGKAAKEDKCWTDPFPHPNPGDIVTNFY